MTDNIKELSKQIDDDITNLENDIASIRGKVRKLLAEYHQVVNQIERTLAHEDDSHE